MTRRPSVTAIRILIACCTTMGLAAGCGDSLSSLDSVQRSSRRVFAMDLKPDFGRRGKTVTVEVTSMDPELEQILTGGIAYPTEITFGRDVFIRSFGTNTSGNLEIEVFVSPLAEKGERIPTLVFSAAKERLEARGSFWVLPAQPE